MGFVKGDGKETPLKALFDFRRIELQPGESQIVFLTATPSAFSAVSESGVRFVEEKTVRVAIGDTVAPVGAEIRLTGQRVVLEDYSMLFE
mmetsp:Transcript_31229/g.54903  ORF Transcript_31229/g.54903 Transcript_31229/m.54903 type:complete len:90 (-) Transcript_31229:9-278(-)